MTWDFNQHMSNIFYLTVYYNSVQYYSNEYNEEAIRIVDMTSHMHCKRTYFC
jgi:hypothetical protein